MKRGIVFLSLAAALIGAFSLGRARAQEGNDEMAAWMELAKPGPQHAAMMKSVGTWNVEVKEMQPDGTSKVSKGKAVRTEVFGGRFVKEEYEGTMMGMPFHGMAYMGFNNANKKYEMTWMDSMGTGIMFMTGAETEPGKAWEYKGSFFGPGGKEIKSRSVVKKTSDDQTTMQMFNDMGSGEMCCMEMTYTRAK